MINSEYKDKLKKDLARSLYKIEFILYYMSLYSVGKFDLINLVQSLNGTGGDLSEELDYKEDTLWKLRALGVRSYGLSGDKAKQFIEDNEEEVNKLLIVMKKDYQDLFRELYKLNPDYKLEIPQITKPLIS